MDDPSLACLSLILSRTGQMKKTHKALLWLHAFMGKRSATFTFLKWFLLSVPSGLVVWANSRTNVLYQLELKNWFEDHPIMFLLCFLIPMLGSATVVLYNNASTRIIPMLESKGLKIVLGVHGRYFEDKLAIMRRCYYDQCSGKRGSGITVNHLFSCAIKPQDAIQNLIKEASLSLQEELFNGSSIKIVLAQCEGEKVVGYKAFYPTGSSHMPSQRILLEPTGTFFDFIISKRDSRVIEDIEKEIRCGTGRYKGSDNVSHNKGSIIGIPIINVVTEQVAFVLTIKSDETALINDYNKTSLEAICDPFCRWIMFERQMELFSDTVH